MSSEDINNEQPLPPLPNIPSKQTRKPFHPPLNPETNLPSATPPWTSSMQALSSGLAKLLHPSLTKTSWEDLVDHSGTYLENFLPAWQNWTNFVSTIANAIYDFHIQYNSWPEHLPGLPPSLMAEVESRTGLSATRSTRSSGSSVSAVSVMSAGHMSVDATPQELAAREAMIKNWYASFAMRMEGYPQAEGQLATAKHWLKAYAKCSRELVRRQLGSKVIRWPTNRNMEGAVEEFCPDLKSFSTRYKFTTPQSGLPPMK